MKKFSIAMSVLCVVLCGCAQTEKPSSPEPRSVARPAGRVTRAHARHILVKDIDTAHSIRKQLMAGADFDALAQKHSLCPSKRKGGDLGTFGPGRMVPEFDKASFNQPVLAFSVVKTKFGYHVLQVLERE